ncbi:MAG: SCO family protein [Thermomicrobiales bacterium]|nr:SCO family protein [Thermomicrobiales bacterium]MCO5221776.1 SCO family protein [Thermomicrobiales bacterium]
MTTSSNRRYQLLGVLGILALVAASVIYWATNRTEAYEFNGGEISPAAAAPALDLTDQNGESFSLSQENGNVSLIYFGYTTCPDLCPTTLIDFTTVKDELGEDGADVDFIMVTFDPERDTEERMKEYLNFFDPEFIGLRGDDAQTEQFLTNYGVTVNRVEYPESETGYLLDHTALIYVIDKEGRLRLTYPYGTDPLMIVEDVQHLVKE